LVVLSLLAWTGVVCASAFELSSKGWDGCSEFVSLLRRELGSERVLVRATLPWGELTPADGVMFLHPKQAIDEREAVAFMVAGGRIAVLDDHGRGKQLLARFKIYRQALPDFPEGMLRDKAALPLASVVVDDAGGQVHPTVASVQRVALNHATGLAHPGLSTVLEVRGRDSEAVAVAVAGQVGQGRLFAMSDPSAFINEMLRFPDNRQFAKSLGRYLAGGDARGEGRLWLLSGRFEQRPGFAKTGSLRQQLEAARTAVTAGFEDLRQHGLPWWAHIALAAVLLGAVSYYMRRALLLRYEPHLPRYVRQPELAAQGGLAGRVAVLSAPTTSATLALMELRLLLGEALGEALAERPGEARGEARGEALRPVPDPRLPSLVARWRESVSLPPGLASRLDDTVRLFEQVETALITGRPMATKTPPLSQVSAVIDEVIDTLRRADR
jgi:hypothetical protein